MIRRVFIFGGVGNQLFQIALAKTISVESSNAIFIDVSGFASDKFYKRTYAISPIVESFKFHVGYSPILFKTLRILRKICLTMGLKEIFNIKFEFNNRQEDLKKNSIYFGYWQDFSFIKTGIAAVKKEIVESTNLSSINTNLLRNLNSPVVALHIRRNHGVKSGHDGSVDDSYNEVSLPFEYYESALALIGEKFKKFSIVVFSDNYEWARNKFEKMSNVIVLKNNRGRDIEDIVLMSKFSAVVCANSSFSWWGGCLSNGIVICPKKSGLFPNPLPHWVTLNY